MKTRIGIQPQGHRVAVTVSVIVGMLLAIAPLHASATNTVSRPVGFVRISVSPSNQVLSAIPFNAFTSTVPGVLRTQLTGGSTSTDSDNVLKWDNSSQSYLTFWKDVSGIWHQDAESLEATNTLEAGDGFWIVNRQASTQAVYLAGHVVLEPTNTVLLGTLLNLFAFPYSTKVGLNGTDLLNDGAVGSSVLTNADQTTETTSNTISWLHVDTNSPLHEKWVLDTNTISSLEMLLGRGYWYNRSGTNTLSWNETRPYPNPFPEDGAPPVITNVTFNGAGNQALLSINTLGVAGELIEVYYQDVVATNAFHTTNGWSIAVLELTVGGSPSISWTDDGSGGRGAINTVFARFYLAGRGDIDADSDGLPDAREVYIYHTDPNSSDTDGDAMPDEWEIQNGLDPLANDASEDPDSDDLTNIAEYQNITNPNDSDSDDDGLPDGWEATYGFNPRSDAITNGLSAWWTFNDGVDSSATNSLGTNYVGILHNMDGGNWTTGLLGGALQFDGTDEYVSVAQGAPVITGEQFSIVSLVNLSSDFGGNWPTLVSDAELRVDNFPTVSTSVPLGWVGGTTSGSGATNGSGDGNAKWSVPVSGNHSNRLVFGGSGSGSSTTRSRNSFVVKSISMAVATTNRNQEWAFNASYDASNTTEPSDGNRWRFWLWADDANLATANGYALEYGKDGTGDRLELYRMTSGSKSGTNILAAGTSVGSGNVQFSVRIQRSVNGVWHMWNISNTASDNTFPTNSPLAVTNDLQTGTNNTYVVADSGNIGFQAFINTASNSSRNLSLDDLSINGQITGFDLRHRSSFAGITGDKTNTTVISVSNSVSAYLDQWQSLAMSYDGTNSSLYVGGNLVTNLPAEFTPALQASLLIGRDHNESTSSFLRGTLDDLRMYKRALTPVEISGSYDRIGDADKDGLSNIQEYQYGSDPTNALSVVASISGTISYTGAQTGLIWVWVVQPNNDLPGEHSIPTKWATSIASPGAYTISNLPTLRSYTIRAGRDVDGNGKIGSCEPGSDGTPVYLTNNVIGSDGTLTEETTPPLLSVPADITLECGQSSSPTNTGFATATDNCDLPFTPSTNIPPPWINEFHYDNTGTDTNEFVEIAGAAGLNLGGYGVYLYNGADGKVYGSNILSGVIDDEGCGYGAVSIAFSANGIQNGDADGLALMHDTIVVQFLSYEGVLTASNGPANGLQSVDVGVDEDPAPAVGVSLQLSGAGIAYTQLVWSAPSAASPGALNVGQTMAPCGNGPVVTYTDTSVAATCPAVSIIKRQWKAVDEYGNSTKSDQYITYQDTNDPSLQIPPDVTIECGDSMATTNTGMATATDECDPTVTISFIDISTGSCPLILSRVWTATDDCGNAAIATQTIQVADTLSPMLFSPADTSIVCGDSIDPTNTGVATAIDICDESPWVSFLDATNSLCPVIVTRTWTASDSCGNATNYLQVISVVGTNCDSDADGLPNCWELDNGLDPLDQGDGATDPDDDGLSNIEEYGLGTNPNDDDTDDDGLKDGEEVETFASNPLISDSDADEVTDSTEVEKGLDPNADMSFGYGRRDKDVAPILPSVSSLLPPGSTDQDRDGMDDAWETLNGFNPALYADRNGDADSDGLLNHYEYQGGANPHNADTDGDTLGDYYEVTYGLNATSAGDASVDIDGDTLTSLQERDAGTNPRLSDTDGDGYPDDFELAWSSMPTSHTNYPGQPCCGADPDSVGTASAVVTPGGGGNYNHVASLKQAMMFVAGGGGRPIIKVTPGCYFESIAKEDFPPLPIAPGSRLLIIGYKGPLQTTFVGQHTKPVMELPLRVVIDGLSLVHAPYSEGDGVRVVRLDGSLDSAAISRCIIGRNNGHGVTASGAFEDLRIQRTVVSQNKQSAIAFNGYNQRVEAMGCTFVNNEGTGGSHSINMPFSSSSAGYLKDCIVWNKAGLPAATVNFNPATLVSLTYNIIQEPVVTPPGYGGTIMGNVTIDPNVGDCGLRTSNSPYGDGGRWPFLGGDVWPWSDVTGKITPWYVGAPVDPYYGAHKYSTGVEDCAQVSACAFVDSDGDGLPDWTENDSGTYVDPDNTGTDPNNPDTDGDGWGDGEEVSAGTSPHDKYDALRLGRGLVINEVMFDPTGTDTDKEWIELFSTNKYSVDLEDFRLQVSSAGFNTVYTFPSGTVIQPGDFLLIGGSQVANRDITVSLQMINRSSTGGPTEGVRILVPAEAPSSPEVVDALLYGTPNSANLPTDGFGTDGLSSGSPSGSTVSRAILGRDTDSFLDWRYNTAPVASGSGTLDIDGDGINNIDELSGALNSFGHVPTNPEQSDTDGDGLSDGAEVTSTPPTNPDDIDTDGDMFPWPVGSENFVGSDAYEDQVSGTIPTVYDFDGDGLPDGWESALGLNPNDDDTDNDGTLDGAEDSDGDGTSNLAELNQNSNPVDGSSNTAAPYVMTLYHKPKPDWDNGEDMGLRTYIGYKFSGIRAPMTLCMRVEETGFYDESYSVQWQGVLSQVTVADRITYSGADVAANSSPRFLIYDGASHPNLSQPELGADIQVDLLMVDMKAYRPQNPSAVNYPLREDFPRTAVPDDKEDSPGAGIRANGEDVDENLIEIVLEREPVSVSGVSYFIKRENSRLKIWEDSARTTLLLDAADEADITSKTYPLTLWVEYPYSIGDPAPINCDVAFEARDSGGTVVCSDTVLFYPFKSVLIGLSGEDWPAFGTGPFPPADNGFYVLSKKLYEEGYDVHYFDEDAVAGVPVAGSGQALTQVTSSYIFRHVRQCAIFGTSHGGGSTYDLASAVSAGISGMDIKFTAYADGLVNLEPAIFVTLLASNAPETRKPTGTGYHVNCYQTLGSSASWSGIVIGLIGFDLVGAPVPGSAHEVHVTTQPWGTGVYHGDIDDNANVHDIIIDKLNDNVDR